MGVKNISNIGELLDTDKDKIGVVHFFVDWSDECKNLDNILEALSNQPEYNNVSFKKCAAEEYPEISLKFNVTAVPTVLFFKNGNKIDQLTGADPVTLNEKLKQFANKNIIKHPEQPPVISSDLVVACVQGDNPATEELHSILNNAKIKYKNYDVNSDNAVQERLQALSGSFPQLYIKGEFVGSLESVKKMNSSGELLIRVEAAQKNMSTALVSRLLSLINKSKRMVFMKGEKEAPRCKFSRELTDILKETKLHYDTFDILTDEEVRQGLKVLSNWPTYPQVYVDGEFIGGVDILKELKESGQLLSALKA